MKTVFFKKTGYSNIFLFCRHSYPLLDIYKVNEDSNDECQRFKIQERDSLINCAVPNRKYIYLF